MRWLSSAARASGAHQAAGEDCWRGLALYGVDGTTTRTSDTPREPRTSVARDCARESSYSPRPQSNTRGMSLRVRFNCAKHSVGRAHTRNPSTDNRRLATITLHAGRIDRRRAAPGGQCEASRDRESRVRRTHRGQDGWPFEWAKPVGLPREVENAARRGVQSSSVEEEMADASGALRRRLHVPPDGSMRVPGHDAGRRRWASREHEPARHEYRRDARLVA
jgi:hypothetical protein